jgi:Family of unknown function (DUF6535)
VQDRGHVTFSPSVAIICINMLWFLSLYMYITSAFSATVFQQVTHRYTQMPLALRSPGERARIRSFLFIGTMVFIGVQGSVAWLNLSLFPFAFGLTMFLFTTPGLLPLVSPCRRVCRIVVLHPDHSSFHRSRIPILYSDVGNFVVYIARLPHLRRILPLLVSEATSRLHGAFQSRRGQTH